jgi:hypothetical protein
MTLDFHCLFISLEYHKVLNFTAKGSKGSMSRKVTPSDISHADESDQYEKSTDVELIPLVLCFSAIKL